MVDSVQEKKVIQHPLPEAAPAEDVAVKQQAEEQPEQSATEYTEGQKPSAPKPGFRMNPLLAGKPAASAAAEEAEDEDFLPIPDEFTPPDNSDLVDHLRAAKHKGIPVELESGFRQIVIRRYGNEDAMNGSDRRLSTTNFNERRGEFQKWIDGLIENYGGEGEVGRFSIHSTSGSHLLPNPTSMSRLPKRMLVEMDGSEGKSISVDPIVAYVDATVDGMRLSVVNNITGDTLYQKSFDGFDSDPAETAEDVKKVLADVNLDKEVDSLPPPSAEEIERWEDKWTIRAAKPADVAGASTDAIEAEWRGLDREITVYATPYHLEWDRAGRHDSVWVDLDTDAMNEAGNGPIVIRSRGGIRFDVEKKPGDQAIAASRAGADKLTGLSGNSLSTSTPGVYIRDTGNSWHIWIPEKFAEDEDAPDFAPIELDLSPIGLSGIKHTFYQEVNKPVGKAGEYLLYADGGEAIYEEHKGDIEAVAKGVAQTEVDFGLSEGAIVSRLYAPDTHDKNLSVDDKSEIVINDESFEFEEDLMEIFGRHEALHSCDFHFEISTNSEVVELHEQLKASDSGLFDFIDEKNMYGLTFGGHSADNQYELFASIVNSVYCPQLHEKLEAAPREIREEYFEALGAVRRAIIKGHIDHHMIKPVEMGLPMPNEMPPAPPVLKKIDSVLALKTL